MRYGPKLQPAPFKVAAPGTKMVWTRIDGDETECGRIGHADGKLVHYTWAGKPQYMYLFCIHCAGPEVRFNHDRYAAIFPLETGKSVTFSRRVDQWRWINRIQVIGTERLSLPFAKLDTYVVLSETKGENNPFDATNTMWYAPSIGWNVKFVYRDTRGLSYSWKAVEFQLAH